MIDLDNRFTLQTLRDINPHLHHVMPEDPIWLTAINIGKWDLPGTAQSTMQYLRRTGVLVQSVTVDQRTVFTQSLEQAMETVFKENNAATARINNIAGELIASLHICPHPQPNMLRRVLACIRTESDLPYIGTTVNLQQLSGYNGEWILIPSKVEIPEHVTLNYQERINHWMEHGGNYSNYPAHWLRHAEQEFLASKIVKEGGEYISVSYGFRRLTDVQTITGEWEIVIDQAEAPRDLKSVSPSSMDRELLSEGLIKPGDRNWFQKIFRTGQLPYSRLIGTRWRGVTNQPFAVRTNLFDIEPPRVLSESSSD